MSRSAQRLVDHQGVTVEGRGPGEWIVGAPTGERRLHVYRVAADDWLVSEVGRGNEGRGADLARALAALAGNGPPRDWWRFVPEAIEATIRR
jgi:hypothetical protein